MKALYAATFSILGLVLLPFMGGDAHLAIAQPSTESQDPSVLDAAIAASTIQPPQDLASEVLETFFQSWQIGEANFYQGIAIDAYNNPDEFGDWQTEELFGLVLRLTDDLLTEPTYSNLFGDEPLAQFRTTNLGIWGLESICVAECTEPGFALDLEEFQAIAAKTITPADDDFFNLLQNYYESSFVLNGEVQGWPTFFQLTWDYGGYSLLGEGKHLQLLQQIDQYQQQHAEYLLRSPLTVFARYVQDMRHDLLQDILIRANCSGPEQNEIEAELTQILDQIRLNSAEQTALQQRLEAFQTQSPNIQVNCQTLGQCTCDGG
ncbi:MAG: hypothetical protein AAFQ89_18990 [Cyanobacteria bacterium J06626_18]